MHLPTPRRDAGSSTERIQALNPTRAPHSKQISPMMRNPDRLQSQWKAEGPIRTRPITTILRRSNQKLKLYQLIRKNPKTGNLGKYDNHNRYVLRLFCIGFTKKTPNQVKK